MKSTLLIWALVLTAFSAEPRPARDRTFDGVNADPVWEYKADELPRFAEMLERTGCGAVRIPIRWRVLEPKKEEWDFSALDRAVQSIPEGIEILGTIMSVPEWANGMDQKKAEGWFDAYPPSDLQDWERAVAAIVTHYRHRVKHWEIWNEENGVDFFRPARRVRPTTPQTPRLHKPAYQAAKKATRPVWWCWVDWWGMASWRTLGPK